MKRSWRWALVVGVPVFLIGAVALVLVLNASKITHANYDRVRLGMTSAEVFQILGKPKSAGTMKGYVKGPDHFVFVHDPVFGTEGHVTFPHYFWDGARLNVTVEFSPDDKVIRKQHTDKPPEPNRIDLAMQRLKRWLGL